MKNDEMEKAVAVQIANLLAKYPNEGFAEFRSERIAEGVLESFHEWVDYKPLISGIVSR